jgi:hypothetical protein
MAVIKIIINQIFYFIFNIIITNITITIITMNLYFDYF